MNLTIQEKKELNVLPCDCGIYPEFIQPNHHYTDIWLECPNCGKKTYNTGGYHYAHEIPLVEAKELAIKAWNNREYINR